MTIFRERIQKHKRTAWIVTLAYIIFQGGFAFPLSNELFPFDYSKAVIIIVGYGIIGMCFAGLLMRHRGITVWLLTIGFTLIGMLCRYALEYGEVSNEMNFIPQNIAMFLIAVPLYCLTVYWCIYKFEPKQD